jgi:hypothetical protein
VVSKGSRAPAHSEPADAEHCWRKILTLSRPQKFASVDQGIYGHLTRRNLAALATERGDRAEAVRQWQAVLAECPGDLKARGVTDRLVWVADSFAGLPPPDTARFPSDEGITLHRFSQLAVSLESVRENFRRYGLLDEQVRFLKGWFRDTLPAAPIRRLAVLRLDGDLYESTIQALDALYPKLSPGGYLIVDDYGNVAACRQAVHDYRDDHQITEPIERIDWGGAFWRRESSRD